MSTKTLRKRVALLAVSALGAGVLSLATVLSANAAVVFVGSTNVHANAANGGIYSAAVSGTPASQGLIGTPAGSTTTQTATMYSNGVIVVSTNQVATAQKISVSGGIFAGADKVTSAGGTLTVGADLTSATLTANASNQLTTAIKPNAVGTPIVISGYDNTANAANWVVTVTVVAAGSSGTVSFANSNIALTAAGSAPATANIDTSGANIAENGACVFLYYDLLDANKQELASSGNTIIAKADSGFTVGIGGSGTSAVTTGTYGGAATYLKVCQSSSNINKPVTGPVTLNMNGTDLATRTVTIVGQLAKIVVTEGAIAIRNFAGGTGTPSSTVYGTSPYGTAGAGTATGWAPSHTYVGYDVAGNLVPVTAAISASTADATVTGTGQVQAADPRNANSYLKTGGLTFACNDVSASNSKVQVKATSADTTSIYSNAFNVSCAGSAVNYTATPNKTVFNTGDVATFTVNFADKSGKPANDYAYTSVTSYVGSIASGAIASTVGTGPAAADTSVGGVAKYKYIIGQTGGSYSVAVDFPAVDNTSYNQSALTLPISVASSGASNTDVLKAIVSLIASINKQIAALQKALLKK